MKIGINLLLWTDDPTRDRWLPLYERLAGMGYDGVELPIFDPEPERYAALGQRLEDMGLARTATTVCTAEANPLSASPEIRGAAGEHLRGVVDCCEAAGATLLGGPLYAAIGHFSGTGPTAEEWQRSVEVIRGVADHAARARIALSFEFLNRFEIYLLNATADTGRFVADVGRDNVGIHYDTFHAHIEEKDPRSAITAHADAISHVHISENDRSTPGKGQVDWSTTFEALAAIGYDAWLTVEAFGAALPSIAAATKIWRRMFTDEETLAREAHDFIRQQWSHRHP